MPLPPVRVTVAVYVPAEPPVAVRLVLGPMVKVSFPPAAILVMELPVRVKLDADPPERVTVSAPVALLPVLVMVTARGVITV
jgi:hypothetical protein